jgi:hypothetical protein
MRNRVFLQKLERKRLPGRAMSRRESNNILYILRKSVGRARTGLSWLRICTYYFFSLINKNVAAV